jgi:hypothetical protein
MWKIIQFKWCSVLFLSTHSFIFDTYEMYHSEDAYIILTIVWKPYMTDAL